MPPARFARGRKRPGRPPSHRMAVERVTQHCGAAGVERGVLVLGEWQVFGSVFIFLHAAEQGRWHTERETSMCSCQPCCISGNHSLCRCHAWLAAGLTRDGWGEESHSHTRRRQQEHTVQECISNMTADTTAPGGAAAAARRALALSVSSAALDARRGMSSGRDQPTSSGRPPWCHSGDSTSLPVLFR